ncbi:MAG: alpha/beta hydrolase [Actinomycetales bacterium]|nr:alpha/beta hydrolase [Actinomycetales bacterium]
MTAPRNGSAPTEQPAEPDPLRAQARALDAALPEIDWTIPAEGAVHDEFAAPSGPLARWSVGPADGERVLMVPGASGSKEDFVLLAPPLVAAGYWVEAIDLAGQYESHRAGPAAGARYDYELFVGDLLALLEAGGPAHLLGYSFAATLAQLALLRRPELVLSLALLSPTPDHGDAFRTIKKIGALSPFVGDRTGAGLMIWGIRTNKNKVGASRLGFVRDRFALTRRDSMDDIIGLMRRTPDLDHAVRAQPIPKLVAVGEHDLWPVHRHADFARRIGARFAVYPTGHSPCETTPNEFALDLLALYEAAGATPSSSS